MQHTSMIPLCLVLAVHGGLPVVGPKGCTVHALKTGPTFCGWGSHCAEARGRHETTDVLIKVLAI